MKREKTILRTDLRSALIVVTVMGAVFLAILTILLGLNRLDVVENDLLLYFGLAIFALDVLVSGILLLAYLLRYGRVSRANEAADLMKTEIGDLFRYEVDLPYAIVAADGTVKIVSGFLQNILGFRSPVCNVPLSNFCTVPMEQIIGYAQNGAPVRDITYTEDGVPIDHTKPMIATVAGRQYELQCYVLRSRGIDYYFVVFRDVTDILALQKREYEDEPVVAYIVIDSLQELAQYVRVSYRTAVSEIETILKTWAAGFGAMLQEYDREKYLLVLDRKALDECIRKEFPILETVRSVQLGDSSFPVTISMGVGAVKGSFEEKEKAASDALDIALQKGGDQVAVNDGKSITPYGGRTNTMTSSTTITSRVNSQHLCYLIRKAGNVLIMGHRAPDYDSIGSCVGLARLAISARGGDASRIRIVIDRDHANFRTCYDTLAHLPEYRSMFISGDAALDSVRLDTLLIVSDVSNVYNMQEPQLTKCVKDIVIIDHHRRPDQMYEFRPLMTYIRPGVAAASELVSEMLELSPYRDQLLKEEATLMLAGLMLDTKNFTAGAEMQTFSAVHYLYERGAHAQMAKPLFNESLTNLFTAVDIDSRTRTYRDKIALTWHSVDHDITEQDRINIAKAADKLMTVSGIEASFVLLHSNNIVTISARSSNKINVEIIMKRLGGGGHFNSASAQLEHASLESASQQLKAVLDDYLDHEYGK